MDTNLPTRLVNQYWWLMLIWGILVVFFGVCALFGPYLISLTPIVLFVAFALINGVFGIILAFQEHRVLPSWWVALVTGVLSILFGLAITIWPHITAVIALDLIAIWAIITGTLQIASALSGMSKYSPLFLAIIGAASILLGMILFVSSPLVALLPLLRVFGIYGLIYGGMLMMRAFSFRSLFKHEQPCQSREPEWLQ